ncbi:MAG: aspartate aminotransferase family protein [Oceanospirillaceae bacterium]|nr:aspartate aminotransferase family protein [Oceanospirillaceae bacterium]
MQTDQQNFAQLSAQVSQWITQFQQQLPQRRAALVDDPQLPAHSIEPTTTGTQAAFAAFKQRIAPHLSATAGPRYFGFVTGGCTPAALLADWIVAGTDQNVAQGGDSISSEVESQALAWLRELFHLPNSFEGTLTTGATASNILGLLCARQFGGAQQGIDIARDGFSNADISVFSATPHASSQKAMAIAGLGRNQIQAVGCLADSEAMDVASLAKLLAANTSPGKIVIASTGTVTGTDFDDLVAIAALCKQHNAWLHVDAAFGIFSRLLPEKRDLSAGIELADSITCDGHKWLNVPYDCGIFYTRHLEYLQQVCSVAAPYLDIGSAAPSFMDRGIENSRRFRALPVWMTLQAYGIEGYREMIAANCQHALQLAQWIEASDHYELLTPCNLNVVVFRPKNSSDAEVKLCLTQINASGETFMTPGFWGGNSAIRAAISNWKTTAADIEQTCRLLEGL